ncbi:alcohol dehydrogenase catalytic domain-containing protein [Alkalihalobacillus oceani]|uniref:zinc-dependent alcohol dehydrogenase n=1 Tax=Halalkalibacter oceani TaxID=1653776 RepID=UPI00203A4492|nr:alcohol dehydrogenase catalytic domain-containing protein [Halalkalibacter oceani]MCM3761339.1 alcohol dehydrogenase catalytic domain-containing protein [Halalkalibacter oceani]
MSMKAVAKTQPGYGNFELINLPIPNEPSDHEVLIEIKSVGVCGTDLSIYKWTETVAKEYNPSFPLIPGHEFAGVVKKVGKKVINFKVGDKVAVNPHISCGKCQFCKNGSQNICQHRPILGCHANGGLTQYVKVREQNVFRLPDHLPIYLGSLAEPMSVAVHALKRVENDKNNTAVIVGAGTVGLLQVIACRAAGYQKVMVLGLNVDKGRLKIAESLGAISINIETQDVFAAMKQHIGMPYADVVFEAAGTNSSIKLSIDIVKPTGSVALTGIASSSTDIETTKLVFAEKSIIGCRAYNLATWPITMELMGRSIEELKLIVTHRKTISEFAEAIELLITRESLKVVIEPHKM